MTETKPDVWARLAAPLDPKTIAWRQDGKPTQRDGKWFARFVCYVEAGTVRERLDAVVPGEWDLTLDLLPNASDADGVALCAFKARLAILGGIREDVGQGQDYKAAATDAFKRAAVRFGIGHELYQMGQTWVQVDSDSKYAKPVEDPATVYARKHNGQASAPPKTRTEEALANVPKPTGSREAAPLASDEPSCPKCGGPMWDNRLTKRNPKAPDFKCRNRSCDGVIWPPKPGEMQDAVKALDLVPADEYPAALRDAPDDLPF